jgi:hypothetical protein
MAFPLVPTVLLGATAWLPEISQQPRLQWSILGAAGALLLGIVAVRMVAGQRTLSLLIQPRPQHYLQACAQFSVLLYWGWYWPPVYEALPLLGTQLAFAYAFDMLLAWARRSDYTLGFAPFPVIFSINLFLWFKSDWFYLQFVMIAIGFAAKELIRWEKEGRRVHIFNPSSFPLAVVSLILIVTGSTSMTWGPEIATTQNNPPNIYLFLFLIGLPGQFLFGVTTMTMSAVLTTYLFGVIYFALTGVYFFVDSYIPIAVFLGMHLLFTDPSTSPRTELGRIVFGMLYGLGNIVLYEMLGRAGIPTFYDKLLPVPLMNLSIRFIDRVARSVPQIDPARIGASLAPRRRNLAYIAVWATVFVAISSVDGLGDHHPGHRVPFWVNACQQDARNACSTLNQILTSYCAEGSGWACNELGMLRAEGKTSEEPERAIESFLQACRTFPAACANVGPPGAAGKRRAPPQLEDYAIVLQDGKGPVKDRTSSGLMKLACEQGWPDTCGRP